MENECNFKLDTQNVEQQKAFDLVANTNTCLFITGKAGTGKTTFIKRIQEEINKNFLVLAPTGIAAIAVGGQTMHSFFGFPMHAMGVARPCTPSLDSPCTQWGHIQKRVFQMKSSRFSSKQTR